MQFTRVEAGLLAKLSRGRIAGQDVLDDGPQHIRIGRPLAKFPRFHPGVAQESFNVLIPAGQEGQAVQGKGFSPFFGQLVPDQRPTRSQKFLARAGNFLPKAAAYPSSSRER